MRSTSILFAWSIVFAVGPVAGAAADPPSPGEDQERDAERSTRAVRERGRLRAHRAPKRVLTPGMRRTFPKNSPEKELVVRYTKYDDGYLIYHIERTDQQRAKIAAYRKMPVRKVPRRARHSIRVQLEDAADEVYLRRRKGQRVRLKIKQDRTGQYVVRDVLPMKR